MPSDCRFAEAPGDLESADDAILVESIAPVGTAVMGVAHTADLGPPALSRDRIERIAWVVVGDLLQDASLVDGFDPVENVSGACRLCSRFML
jgi:hypothetical protein